MITTRYPIFIISKGRWEKRLTAKALDAINVPYRIVIEPQELGEYEAVIDPAKILTLPFSNLGQGSIPARNWVWQRSIEEGAQRHWIMDDNIKAFYRFNRNLKVPVSDGAIFRAAEDFTDRYANVLMSGLNYFMFASRKSKSIKPFTLNTRIYSCILLSNSTPLRWRGRYNEDTDLSLRILKAGFCTILFNAFLAEKTTTMKMKGGNTDELYKKTEGFDGRLEMAKSLAKQHPDVTKITRKWGRYQHHVDYRPFAANKLKLKRKTEIDRPDNQGTVALGYIEHGGERYRYREVDWSEATETAAMVAANAHGGTWDKEMLRELLSDISEGITELTITGMTKAEIDRLMRIEKPLALEGGEEKGIPAPEESEEVPTGQHVRMLQLFLNEKNHPGFIARIKRVCADVHEWHGNTRMHGKLGTFERISLVFYYREKMIECGSPEEEAERANQKRNAIA